MKYETHCDRNIPIEGSRKIGQILCDYSALIKVFGQPLESLGYETNVEWNILFIDGDDEIIVTIYDWNSEVIPEKNKIWMIGGYSENSLRYVHLLLKEYLLEEE